MELGLAGQPLEPLRPALRYVTIWYLWLGHPSWRADRLHGLERSRRLRDSVTLGERSRRGVVTASRAGSSPEGTQVAARRVTTNAALERDQQASRVFLYAPARVPADDAEQDELELEIFPQAEFNVANSNARVVRRLAAAVQGAG